MHVPFAGIRVCPSRGRSRAASIQSWKPQANGCWIVRNEASNPCPCCPLRLASRRHSQDRCRSAFAGPQSAHRNGGSRRRSAFARSQSAAARKAGRGEAGASGRAADRAVDRSGNRCRQGEMQGTADRRPARLRDSAANQGRHLRGAGAGPVARGRHRSEGRDRPAGNAELPDGRCARRMAARHRPA
jgi:hypothetical protein